MKNQVAGSGTGDAKNVERASFRAISEKLVRKSVPRKFVSTGFRAAGRMPTVSVWGPCCGKTSRLTVADGTLNVPSSLVKDIKEPKDTIPRAAARFDEINVSLTSGEITNDEKIE